MWEFANQHPRTFLALMVFVGVPIGAFIVAIFSEFFEIFKKK